MPTASFEPPHPADPGNARPDPCWAQYPNTRLQIYRDGIVEIDLRLPLTSHQCEELASLGLGHHFCVVTACNPRGQELSDAENHLRIEALDLDACNQGCRFLRADGVSIDGKHREPGLALALDLQAGVTLAHRWDQTGLFLFDRSCFWLVDVNHPNTPIQLPTAVSIAP